MKIASYIFLLVVVLSLTACGGDGPCAASFAFKYCLDQSSSSSSVTSSSSSSQSNSSQGSSGQVYSVGGSVSGLRSGQAINISLNRPALFIPQPTESPALFLGDSTIGWSFTLENSRTLTYLGLYNTDLKADTTVGLWNSSGTLIASTIFPVGLTGVDQTDLSSSGFLWKSVTSQSLPAGQYTIGAYSMDDHFGAYGITAVTTVGLNLVGTSLYNLSGAVAKPEDDFSAFYANGFYGPNLRFGSSVQKTMSADGSFTFDAALANGDIYALTVSPLTGSPVCTVTSGNGKVNATNVSGITIRCN